MLQAIFLILLLQLAGEIIQQFFQLTVPGPVIGLVMLLCMLLVHRRLSGKMRAFEQQLMKNQRDEIGKGLRQAVFMKSGSIYRQNRFSG